MEVGLISTFGRSGIPELSWQRAVIQLMHHTERQLRAPLMAVVLRAPGCGQPTLPATSDVPVSGIRQRLSGARCSQPHCPTPGTYSSSDNANSSCPYLFIFLPCSH